MPKFNVSEAKDSQLTRRMSRLGVRELDIVEKFVKGSGPGGQKINKTSSCVWLRHLPSGIEIKCQRERSQAMNRFFARRLLCDRLEERIFGERSRRQQEAAKIRRQKKRRSRRQRERLLCERHERSEKKQFRRTVDIHED